MKYYLVNFRNTSNVYLESNNFKISESIDVNWSMLIDFKYFLFEFTYTDNLYSKSYRKYALFKSYCCSWRSATRIRIKIVTVISSLGVNLIIYKRSDSFAIKIRVFSKYLIISSGITSICDFEVNSLNLSSICRSSVNINYFKLARSVLAWLKLEMKVYDWISYSIVIDCLTPPIWICYSVRKPPASSSP